MCDKLSAGDTYDYVLSLRLQTGEIVCLFGEGVRHSSVTLHQCDDSDPAMTLRHFGELTGLGPDKVTPLP